MDLDHLRNAVLALASEAEVQASLYPTGTCKGDELVLDFGDSLLAARKSDMRSVQVRALDSRDQLIASFSAKASGDMFVADDALFTDPRWNEIRLKAREVLDAFEWPWTTPRKNGSTYVFTDEVIENS